jgi:hypothetical protein
VLSVIQLPAKKNVLPTHEQSTWIKIQCVHRTRTLGFTSPSQPTEFVDMDSRPAPIPVLDEKLQLSTSNSI